MEEEHLACSSINAIVTKMETISVYLQDPCIVLQVASMPQYKITTSQIAAMRAFHRRDIVAEMEQFKTRVNEKFAKFDFAASDMIEGDFKTRPPKFEIAPFLQLFTLFKGIQQFYLEESMANEEKRKDNSTGFASKDEKLILQLCCSEKWPICIFDFTVIRTLHDFFVFKVKAPRWPLSSKAAR